MVIDHLRKIGWLAASPPPIAGGCGQRRILMLSRVEIIIAGSPDCPEADEDDLPPGAQRQFDRRHIGGGQVVDRRSTNTGKKRFIQSIETSTSSEVFGTVSIVGQFPQRSRHTGSQK